MAKQDQGIADIPFEERLFTSRQTRQILNVGKTTFFKVLPQLDAFLDGNRLKITGRSIREYQGRRLAVPRVARPMPQLHKSKPKADHAGVEA
jgi:hypothetical protein